MRRRQFGTQAGAISFLGVIVKDMRISLSDLRNIVREAVAEEAKSDAPLRKRPVGDDDEEKDDDILTDDVSEGQLQNEARTWKEKLDDDAIGDDKLFYENLARTIVFSHNNATEDVSWRKVAENYARGKRSMGGPHLDVNALYEAIVQFLDENQDVRDPNLSKVKKIKLGSPCTPKS